MKKFFFLSIAMLIFSCSADEEISTISQPDQFSTKSLKSNQDLSKPREGVLHDDYPNDEMPVEFIKVLEDVFKVKVSDVIYNRSTGDLEFGDMILHENYLAPYIIDPKLLEEGERESREKGYTLTPNHTTTPGAPSIIRCSFGQSVQDFQNYQIVTTYEFDNNFPTSLRNSVREAFDEWEAASNNKFIWNEVSSNGHTYLQWDYALTSDLAKAGFPSTGITGYNVGDIIRISNYHFNPQNGDFVTTDGLSFSELKATLKNVTMHEIGHNLGIAHFHDAWDEPVHHVSGTLTHAHSFDNDVTIMSTYRDHQRPNLYTDDIQLIQTLYPYTGNGSMQCHSSNDWPNVKADGFSMMFALCDLNMDGRVSVLDVVATQRYILGQSTHGLSPYAIQKAAAMDPVASTSIVSVADLVRLQNLILGSISYQVDITQAQWEAMADANMDGTLTSSDGSNTYLPGGKGVWGGTNSVARANLTTEIQATCANIDGNPTELTYYEYNIWINNL